MMLSYVGRATPLVVVFVGMCIGILAFTKDIPFFLFCFSFLILLFSKERILLIIIGVVLGFAAIFYAPKPIDLSDGEYLIHGIVQEAGFMRGSYRVVLDEVSIDGKKISGKAMIRIIKTGDELRKGINLEGPVQLRNRYSLGNPGEFDYRRYLLSEGITVSGYVKDINELKSAGAGRPSDLKKNLTSLLSKYSRPEAEILKAVITGDRSGLVYSLQDSFSSLGVAHLIAISGLNMGIIYLMGLSLAFLFLRFALPVSRRYDTPLIAKITGVVCVILYTSFVGYSAPAVRSAVMVIGMVVSLIFTRKSSLLEGLAAAGIIILIWMPYSLYSASFLLSFCAVLGIIGTYNLLKNAPQWFLFAVITIVSMAFTAPIVVFLFGYMSPVSIPANIIFVPWFSFIIMPLGMAGLFSSMISDGLSSYLLSLTFDGIGLILKTSGTFGGLAPIACPGIYWIMICYWALITALFAKPSFMKTFLIITGSFLIFSIPLGVKIHRTYQPTCFDIISVGQGDSILITKGAKAVLIDAGGSFTGADTGRFIVGPHLLKRGVTKLDLVVATHSHPDHIGGMPFILSRFPVREIWMNVKNDSNADFQSVIRIAKEESIPIKNVSLGDFFSHEGLEIKVLNPPEKINERTKEMDLNLQSIVLRISDGTLRGLFMADAGGLGEIRLCRLEQDISVDILKTAHHGSKNSCLAMFLDHVKPRAAIISVGAKNHFHLPNKASLERMKQKRVKIYRTDLDGNIMVTLENNILQVKSGMIRSDNVLDSITLPIE